MDFKTFHEHFLLFDKYKKQESCCRKCNQQIDGWAYTCESCKFWLHDSCDRQDQLPSQIPHALHPQHNLMRNNHRGRGYICSKCFNLCRGHRYHCECCNFNLDLSCAFTSTNDGKNKPNDFKSKQIWHFSFEMPLTLFNYRKVGKYDYSCSWCERHLSGICCGNLDTLNNVVLFHESCLHEIPSILSFHPFHPSHPLQILEPPSLPPCNACKYNVSRRTQAYCCRKCNFHLHVGCAKLRPSIKVELHEHELTYFRSKSFNVSLPCKICDQDCRAEGKETGFYRCVVCDFSYHFHCLGMPPFAKHKYHRHPLKLVRSFIEDDSTEYYCDICEEERKPDHHVYCCKKCKFVAHIECAINKVYLMDRKALIRELMEKEKTEHINAKFSTYLLDIEYFDHPHALSFIEAVEQNEKLYCNACGLEISGQCYNCKSCKYSLHKECSILPYEVLHPLHPQHSVKLFADLDKPFTCHGCRCHSYGFVYKCYPCDFQLDVGCATSTTPPKIEDDQRLTKIERSVSKLCPFDPNHEPEFFTRRPDLREDLKCEACYQSIVGSAYRCRECLWVVLDESCIESLKEMQHPFHQLHPLRPHVVRRYKSCSACRNEIKRICYGCEQCQIYVDLDCARALKLTPLKWSYGHDLFYFGPDTLESSYACDECGESCKGAPFYFCSIRKIYLHLECARIPMSVKSEYHIHHRLILKNHFVEDNSGEYYCDVCEEQRNPKNHVYYCEECCGLFVAHIECVLNMMEGPD